jgi:hypothetical protein
MVYVQMRFLSNGLLWISSDPDIYGQPTFSGPVNIRHRWEDRSGLFINSQGRQEAFKHRVYTDVKPKPGDRLAKRSTDTFESSHEIKDVREILNVSGKKREVRVLL